MKRGIKLVLASMLLTFLSACGTKEEVKPNTINEDGTFDAPIDTIIDIKNNPDINYDKEHLLVKYKENQKHLEKDDYDSLGIIDIQEITGTKWYTVSLRNGLTSDRQIEKFRKSKRFDLVDYDYIFGKGAEDENSQITTANYDQSAIFDSIHLEEAYQYMEDNGAERGGSDSVIVAVLDTGVDINHIDLRDNIWTNTNETDNNGNDDDNNGYVDDIHGWNFVADNANVIDDNGHGTHVAGIIGSEKNDYGTTGIAYNCKIMPVKCGNSSGYFNNSWVAGAITYAASNGADVINMSFGGGSAMSLAVEEALENAYTTSFLVAAAGNNGLKNEKECEYEISGKEYITIYPASYPSVFGVMSASIKYQQSEFSNYDLIANNKIEYNLYAPGENYPSTFPNNKYALLNGTSMAAPAVSGVAALIRSMHPQKDEYPTKFISSQLANTSETKIIDGTIFT